MTAIDSDRTAPTLDTTHRVLGPWSLATSKRFWEGFAPSALEQQSKDAEIRAVFLCDNDWQRVSVVVTQQDDTARISVSGPGDLEAATAQVLRFLSLDIDGRGWPAIGDRDPVIADAQRQLPGLRPCGFYSPYEAAVWSVLSQRVQMRQAAVIKADIQRRFGDDGAFPSPEALRQASISLPGRKEEYLHAVADAAIAGHLGGAYLRGLDPTDALREVQKITGIGPFAAELIVIRGANFADVVPLNEKRLEAEIDHRYGTSRPASEISAGWAPFRSWASVHLRALREERTHEIAGR